MNIILWGDSGWWEMSFLLLGVQNFPLERIGCLLSGEKGRSCWWLSSCPLQSHALPLSVLSVLCDTHLHGMHHLVFLASLISIAMKTHGRKEGRGFLLLPCCWLRALAVFVHVWPQLSTETLLHGIVHQWVWQNPLEGRAHNYHCLFSWLHCWFSQHSLYCCKYPCY